MSLCTSICINNAIAAAALADAAATMHNAKDKDDIEDVSVWFALLAMAIVFVVIPAIVVGILMLVV